MKVSDNMVKLTDKQKLFVKEYLVDLNATQSAIRSGYSVDSARQIGTDNLSKTYIQEAIQKEMAKRAEKTELTAEWVLKNLKSVAERCMQEEAVMKYEGGEYVETGEYKFDSSGANKSLELIGKHLKMFTEKTEFTGNINITSPVDELVNSIKSIKQ